MCKPDDCFECRSICEFRGKLDQPEFRIAELEAECGRLWKLVEDEKVHKGNCCYDNERRAEAAEAKLSECDRVYREGHSTPCTLGPLCPYCHIEHIEAALEAAREQGDALARFGDEKLVEIDALRSRAESAEAALAAVLEKIPTVEKANMGEFMGHPFSYWLALEELVARNMMDHGSMIGEIVNLRVELAAARDELESLTSGGWSNEIAVRDKTIMDLRLELAALRSRADDAGRVERVIAILRDRDGAVMDYGEEYDYREVARAVLAAADGKEDGE
jgi:hypothetical protein